MTIFIAEHVEFSSAIFLVNHIFSGSVSHNHQSVICAASFYHLFYNVDHTYHNILLFVMSADTNAMTAV